MAGVAGLLSALVLLLNLSRRTGIVADVEAVRAVAPLAGVLGLFVVVGLYLRYARQTGALGAIGFGLNLAGLAGVVGVEYVTNYVFPFLPADEVTALADGFTGTMFLLTAVVFLLGVLTFAVALWRSRDVPPVLTISYGAAFALVALRPVLPEIVYHAGLLLGVVALAWLAVHLMRDASLAPPTLPSARPSDTTVPPAHR
jgi:hypothetical protein